MRLLFVGAVNLGIPPANGEEYKNQEIIGYLENIHSLTIVDTRKWNKDPRTLIRLFIHVFLVKYDRIIISASSASVFKLLDVLRFFKKRMQRTIYFVIGGYMPKALQEGRYKVRAYRDLSCIVVEGDRMKRDLRSCGIDTRIRVVPNFKKVIKCWGHSQRFDQKPVRFIFMSRISASKGIDTIFEALIDDQLSNRTLDFTIDFFGPVENEYKENFFNQLENFPNCHYKGYLDFAHNPKESYETMSQYHVMLFPTYWMGEGFPGAVIDAFICGIPVIATDWNMNKEVLTDGVTGRLIGVRDPKALAHEMLDVICHAEDWKTMSEQCYSQASNFDTEKVLKQHLKYIL